MNYRIFVLCFIIIILFTACSHHEINNRFEESNCDSEFNNAEVLAENDHYRIIRADNLFYSYIYNNDHEVVREYGPSNKQMHIVMVEDDILKFTLQAGTGLQTQWGYYYDINRNIFSDSFYSIGNECNGLVALISSDKIIIQDIFDKTRFYQEITSFKEPFSTSAVPIISAEFSNDASEIVVSYLSGDDYKTVTESIKIEN